MPFGPLHKRFLLPSKSPPLWQRYKQWTPDALREAGGHVKLDVPRDVLGHWSRPQPTNDWHFVTISLAPGGDPTRDLVWRNRAGRSWALTLDAAASLVRTGTDCPYRGNHVSLEFDVATAGGAPLICRLGFNGDVFVRGGGGAEVAAARRGKGEECGEQVGYGDKHALLESVGHAGSLSPLGVSALRAFLKAGEQFKAGDAVCALRTLETLWAAHPPGTVEWHGARAMKHGSNFGTPTCYYALRMMQDIFAFAAGRDAADSARSTGLNLTVVGVPAIKARMPRTSKEADTQPPDSWPEVTRLLNPALRPGSAEAPGVGEDGMAGAHVCHTVFDAEVPPVFRTALYWWGEHIWAISGGRLHVHVRMGHLPQGFIAEGEVNHNHAGLAGGGCSAAAQAAEGVLGTTTDVWLVTYPSVTPQLDKREYITGGMGRAGCRGRPCFIADDAWFRRKPPHLGCGEQSHVERAAYMPQWFNHEWNHANFGYYFPEDNLEERGHIWFERSTWPPDFSGTHEADYYYEALHKRFLLPSKSPPLWQRYKQWTPDALREAGGHVKLDVPR
eukprot:Hpha_TRINITY_DN13363_c0_g1::TRINITY_DN13363_c0_g1_i3::g.95654::m.95654